MFLPELFKVAVLVIVVRLFYICTCVFVCRCCCCYSFAFVPHIFVANFVIHVHIVREFSEILINCLSKAYRQESRQQSHANQRKRGKRAMFQLSKAAKKSKRGKNKEERRRTMHTIQAMCFACTKFGQAHTHNAPTVNNKRRP